jgi:transcriptional/translational regulatory protein YebC/TACO1
VLIIENNESIDDDEIMLEAIEAGAEDIEIDEDQIEIYTEISAFAKVRKKFKADGFTFEMAELRYIPQNMTTIENEEAIEQMHNLIEMLEENDDVQKVYHNWKNH